MATGIFGISNDGLNLAVNLFILLLVVLWLALVVYTYLDAKRRVSDPFLVGCATLGSLIPYIGTAVYAIVRPPEFLEDVHERELEIKAAELRVRQLKELSCPGCGSPIDKTFLRCPRCQRRLKDPCGSCGKPVDPSWKVCPYCEASLPGSGPPSEREPRRRKRSGREPATTGKEPSKEGASSRSKEDDSSRRSTPSKEGEKSREPAKQKRTKGSASSEPHSDPRQA